MKHALAIAAIEGDGANILFFKKGVGEAAQQAAIGREQAVFRACGKLSGLNGDDITVAVIPETDSYSRRSWI